MSPRISWSKDHNRYGAPDADLTPDGARIAAVVLRVDRSGRCSGVAERVTDRLWRCECGRGERVDRLPPERSAGWAWSPAAFGNRVIPCTSRAVARRLRRLGMRAEMAADDWDRIGETSRWVE